jgi:hypothetical protein
VLFAAALCCSSLPVDLLGVPPPCRNILLRRRSFWLGILCLGLSKISWDIINISVRIECCKLWG